MKVTFKQRPLSLSRAKPNKKKGLQPALLTPSASYDKSHNPVGVVIPTEETVKKNLNEKDHQVGEGKELETQPNE